MDWRRPVCQVVRSALDPSNIHGVGLFGGWLRLVSTDRFNDLSPRIIRVIDPME
jgi:hypothetical protein